MCQALCGFYPAIVFIIVIEYFFLKEYISPYFCLTDENLVDNGCIL